jgi:hypothetical protein
MMTTEMETGMEMEAEMEMKMKMKTEMETTSQPQTRLEVYRLDGPIMYARGIPTLMLAARTIPKLNVCNHTQSIAKTYIIFGLCHQQ